MRVWVRERGREEGDRSRVGLVLLWAGLSSPTSDDLSAEAATQADVARLGLRAPSVASSADSINVTADDVNRLGLKAPDADGAADSVAVSAADVARYGAALLLIHAQTHSAVRTGHAYVHTGHTQYTGQCRSLRCHALAYTLGSAHRTGFASRRTASLAQFAMLIIRTHSHTHTPRERALARTHVRACVKGGVGLGREGGGFGLSDTLNPKTLNPEPQTLNPEP